MSKLRRGYVNESLPSLPLPPEKLYRCVCEIGVNTAEYPEGEEKDKFIIRLCQEFVKLFPGFRLRGVKVLEQEWVSVAKNGKPVLSGHYWIMCGNMDGDGTSQFATYNGESGRFEVTEGYEVERSVMFWAKAKPPYITDEELKKL